MAIEILPLTKQDIPAAVECVQTAFADDPYFQWLFDDASYDIHRNAASLAAHFHYGLNCNMPMYIAKTTLNAAPDDKHPPHSVVGVSWWYAPQPASAPLPWSIWAQDWLLSMRQLLYNIRFGGRGGLNLSRYRLWKAMQEKTHEKVWTDPRGYYFCNVLAVSAQMRGMGVGKKLVQVVTDRADREGVKCYLESSKGVPNLVIYEKLGFGLVKEIECVDGVDKCKLYCMTRNPSMKV
ncbi:acetyltransferase, GNAT family [Aspergillus steynii IBT 23096]|uniref:Acetyltransferase, GNAT family n=1 Tax=Aspergillus steynii IBT 23096 TaxID=1392250 RepID=A0A2I2GPH1_9EURO|nr:acetyltransferase, GNAT family [Aspergillus steynii IBT 23096]PLB54766.1 acetyltransferase, GNAT family [Aspergillus steynii IBT 23096]